MEKSMDPMAAIKVTFFQECEEQLAELETGLQAMKDGDGDSETVNAVFRAVHSIKGGAGAFSLEALVRFAHVFETTLDEVRSGSLSADSDLLSLMLVAADILADLVRAEQGGPAVDPARSQAVADELAAQTGRSGAKAKDEPDDGSIRGLDFVPVMVAIPDIGAAAAAEPEADRWTITFRPKAVLYANANEPALLIRELGRLGDIEVSLLDDDLPLLPDLDPEAGHVGWSIRLTTDQDEQAIRDVFEFVDGDCDLELERQPDAPAEALPAAPAIDVLELIRMAQAGASEDDTSSAQRDALGEGDGLVRLHAPANDTGKAAAGRQAGRQGDHASGAVQTIRVDLERVDRLIDLVGELVINQAMLAQRVAENGIARSSSVAMGLDDLEHLTREIQESVMAIRAQPVKSVFQRMPRLVRELAATTGKQVRLSTDGEGTEVDKTVIERLTDPITHMIRNAIDHGLETPEERVAAGKPAEGTVRLSALHRSGRIVIEVSDDGRGIDRKRVKQKAIERGLIEPDAQLSDDEIDNLIFMPGFSTAATVSDISGRGVGMDVVRRSIQALGGRITIASRPGAGSTFTLSLPLTLAVLDGMVVSVCGETLVVPLTAIVETLQPKANELKMLGPSTSLIAIRDTYVPLIDIGIALGFRDQPLLPTAGVALLIEGEGRGRAAFLVDAIQGQRQVVIKSLEQNYQRVDGIAAATILGDGRVALILDVDATIASRRREVPTSDQRIAAAG